MISLRKALNLMARLIGVVFALAVVAYGILFVVNLHDQDPSEAIAAITNMQASLPGVDDSANSYLFMLGIAGPPDSDPQALGVKRRNWMEEARPEFDSSDDPLSDEYDFRSQRSDPVAELAKACSESERQCLRLLEDSPEIVDDWLRTEDWLLSRYQTLTDMTEFREAVPFDVLAPLPTYSVMFEGQRLLMARAWVLAGQGDVLGVRKALGKDLRFWRMVLRNSDALITKMIASAAVIRHFKLGNLVVRRLPVQMSADGRPESWKTPISSSERSMKRSLAGEWLFFDASNRSFVAESADPFGDWPGFADDTTWGRIGWALMQPFWQPQDMSNRHAQMMLDLGEILDAPFESIPSAVEEANKIQDIAFKPFSRLYNLTGDLAMSAGEWRLSSYAVRVSDLEGIRRAVLLAAELRARGISKDEVVQSLLVSDIVDPYTNEPFSWHDGSDTIIFQGLEPHERATHEIIY